MVIRGGETRAREIAAYQGTEPAVFADMMTHLFGKVQDVYCAMDTLDDRTVENVPVIGSGRVDVEDTWTATIRFKDGPVVTWAYSR
ncbi:MAG: hypothetical protein QGI83_04265, partial [Candidatus Latescibacteria bacterium]|nr:hypothetical protein [Candidatus Latescibacterota bacterium]